MLIGYLAGTYLDIVHELIPMHPSYVWRRALSSVLTTYTPAETLKWAWRYIFI